MNKKMSIVLLAVIIILIISVVAIGVVAVASSQRQFYDNGYVFLTDSVGKLAFEAGDKYSEYITGEVLFKDVNGEKQKISNVNYMHMDDGGIVALSDGVLLDFSDLEAGNINNYYVANRLVIRDNGSFYEAQTNNGDVSMDEHLWKISDDRYIIRSDEISVHFSDSDVRTVSGALEVYINPDGVIFFLLENDMWSTISSNCYIETAGGATINPVSTVIQSGDNKITLGELVLDDDNMIVLSDDEMRRQIVPIFNITTVDGQDGSSGAYGNSGSDGDGGSVGANGQNGALGSKGMDAVSASSVMTSLPSMSFSNWKVSQTGVYGEIVIGGDVNKLETPVISGKDYSGRVYVVDVVTGETMDCFEVTTLGSDYGTGGDTSFDFKDAAAETGSVYFTLDHDKTLKPNTQYKIMVEGYYVINDVVYSRVFTERFFYTDSTGVQVEYLFGNTGEVEVENADETTSLVTYSSATMDISIDPENYSGVSAVEVYVFEKDDSYNLTAELINNANWTQKVCITYVGTQSVLRYRDGEDDSDDALTVGGVTVSEDMQIEFDKLKPNTEYVFRVAVSSYDTATATTATTKILTDQAKEITTIVPGLSVSTTNLVTAYYNRVTGGYEVFRPNVVDTYGKITKYEYIAYDNAGDKVAYKILLPDEAEPAVFYLDQLYYSNYYQFAVYAYYNDNEKELIYSLSNEKSSPVAVTGDNMPQILLTNDIMKYNSFDATVSFDLGASSSIKIDNSRPMTVELYGDYVAHNRSYSVILPDTKYEYSYKSAALENDSVSGSADVAGTLIYNSINEATIIPNLLVSYENLCANTNYTVTVYAYLDLGDGYGYQNRKLGTISFSTVEINKANATMEPVTGGDETTLAIDFKIAVQDDAEIVEGEAVSSYGYTTSQMEQGEIDLQLYRGTGYDKVLISDLSINEPADLQAVYSSVNGLRITNDDFGVSTETGESYTLVVDKLADQSYNKGMGYVNEITQISGYSKVLVANAKLPDLTTNPQDAVYVTEILNEDALLYNVVQDEDLPDDAIIGYRVKAMFDNAESVISEISYYGFEYRAFYNSLASNYDPVEDEDNQNETVTKASLSVGEDAISVPEIAVFFNGTEHLAAVEEGTTMYNDCYVYTGSADFVRGYKFVFAYTATAKSSGESYPYSVSNYGQYSTTYGAGKEGKVYIGKGVAYILNSGLIDAPKIQPNLYTFVYGINEKSLDETEFTGEVDLYYAYDDIDKCINPTAGAQTTKIAYTNYDGTELYKVAGLEEDLVKTVGEVGNQVNWYSIKLPFDVNKGDNISEGQSTSGEIVLTPIINVERYIADYGTILQTLYGTAEEEPVYLAKIPVEYNYEGYFGRDDIKSNTTLNMELDEDNNRINFVVLQSSLPASELGVRAYALKVTFTNQTDTSAAPIVLYLPITFQQDGTVSTQVSTSILEEYSGDKFTVAGEVLYDNGIQGWNLVFDGNASLKEDGTVNGGNAVYDTLFGLQRTYVVDKEDNEFLFGDYYTKNGLSGSSMAGLMNLRADSSAYLKTIDGLYATALENIDEKRTAYIAKFNYAYDESVTPSAADLSKYFAVSNYGVGEYSYSAVSTNPSYVLTPKDVASFPFANIYQDGKVNNVITPNKFVPTVFDISYAPSATAVTIKNLTIKGGIETIASKKSITAYVYSSIKDAQNFSSANKGKVEITIDASTGVFDGGISGVAISGLDAGQIYYLVIAGVPTNQTEEQILLDSNTGELAIYEFETFEGIVLRNLSVNEDLYNNYDYETKYLRFNFSMNQYLQTEVKYEIYDESGENLILSHNDLISKAFITDSALATYNTFNIDLTPDDRKIMMSDEDGDGVEEIVYKTSSSGDYLLDEYGNKIAMQYFEPGEKYIVRLTPFEAGTLAKDYAGENFGDIAGEGSDSKGDAIFTRAGEPLNVEIEIDEAKKVDSLVFVNNATSTTINFGASLTDLEYSIMMQDSSSIDDAYRGSLYVVRFTDSTGKLITNNESITAVHKQVYNVKSGVVNFNLTGLDKETDYVLNIYAMTDYEHDGMTLPTASTSYTDKDGNVEYIPDGTTTKKYSEFFTDIGTTDAPFPKFVAFIDSFWETNGANIESMDVIEDMYLINSRTQKTTPDGGVFFDKDSASIAARDKNRFDLILFESFGIIRDVVVYDTDGKIDSDKSKYDWQFFRSVEWTITGYNSYGEPFNYAGSSSADTGDEMFEKESYLGFFDTYVYSIPCDIISNSKYTVTVILTDENGEKYTITQTYLS